ncbi:GNAT family N-acetyltransferase [Pedobacter sp. PLR]|uniref:GNAT family N-acetyltransferase n=1 Tax=Pedobacter sp. PLR TaxID=2994465 RepID=UPI002248130D|nr:GNAT family N-acetyltransferase [Pedobacter sp. PLR]MCX2452188.1 GNAT family N-acetyltransferase [Pedobacter sp. PLR]
MKTPILTSSLSLDQLTLADAPFLLELVNTPGWKQFIGERNVHGLQDALVYTQKIIDNPDVTYFVVKLNTSKTRVGMLSLIKRDYLPDHDIGFAFLPAYNGKGYAYEAASALLKDPAILAAHSRILATSLTDNVRSIRLLEKLGMVFEKEITNEGEMLRLYGLTLDQRFK